MRLMPKEFWIVVAERDCNPNGYRSPEYGPNKDEGPLVFESSLLTRDQAEDRARALGSKYGWATIVKVVPDESWVEKKGEVDA